MLISLEPLSISRRCLISGLSATLLETETSAQASTSRRLVPGVYLGAGRDGRSRLADYERWLGCPVSGAVDFISYKSWADIKKSVAWTMSSWSGFSDRLTITVPMLPISGMSDLSQGANGIYDSVFEYMANAIRAARKELTIIRIGHEFNGTWYPWSADANTTAWTLYWRRIASIFRSVSAAGFLIEWSPALNKGVLNIESVWPGADVVDIVGASFYNDCTNACIEVPQLRWKSHLNARWGLEWHAAFARKHNKPRSFAEWGTGFRTNGQGGRDDSYFIEKMAQTVADESVIYHNYFDYNAPDFNAKLSSGQFPNAAREFRILFGETY